MTRVVAVLKTLADLYRLGGMKRNIEQRQFHFIPEYQR